MASRASNPGKLRRIDYALLLTAAGMVGSSIFFLGRFDARIDANKEALDALNKRLETTNQRIDGEIKDIQEAQKETEADVRSIAATQDNPIVFSEGRLAAGLDMGVNTDQRRTEWTSVGAEGLCMAYPSGQSWGAVFITVGRPTPPPRPSKNYSNYSGLQLELKGAVGGETVMIGIKDDLDPDDPPGARRRLTLSKEWQVYTVSLADLYTADPKKLYAVTEFVFDGDDPTTVCARKIQFIK